MCIRDRACPECCCWSRRFLAMPGGFSWKPGRRRAMPKSGCRSGSSRIIIPVPGAGCCAACTTRCGSRRASWCAWCAARGKQGGAGRARGCTRRGRERELPRRGLRRADGRRGDACAVRVPLPHRLPGERHQASASISRSSVPTPSVCAHVSRTASSGCGALTCATSVANRFARSVQVVQPGKNWCSLQPLIGRLLIRIRKQTIKLSVTPLGPRWGPRFRARG